MKVHNDLKELLEDFCENYLERKMLDINLTSKQIIEEFASSNSLALGKPEPLAKNKKWIQVCDHKWERVPKSLSLHCKICGRYDHG